MRIITFTFLLLIFSLTALAQTASVEADFNKNVKKYKREKYAVGEDASSGTDYVIYKSGKNIKKMRLIYSNCCDAPKVTDFYFEKGVLLLAVEGEITKKQYKSFASGSNLPLKNAKKLYFKDSKLVKWTENGKEISSANPNWSKEESETLESAKSYFEEYPELKNM
ncbi:MAG TPA: hypothetical protein PKY59_26885 [Pyrinomonadaceae bacterium]|nr:hypothetical protein [Pyrinomonadaceae bacterium]